MSDRLISRFLDTVGDGSGNKNASVDGSATPVEFKFDGFGIIELTRLIVFIRDSGPITAEGYGAIVGGSLTNGIDVEVWKDGSLHVSLFDNIPVKSNADWARTCFDVAVSSFGSGDNYARAQWILTQGSRSLRLASGDQVIIRINDDLSGLKEHYFNLQGLQLLS